MSKSIIEELGLNTPNEIVSVNDVWDVYELSGVMSLHLSHYLFFPQGIEIKKILDEKNEILEALIDLMTCDALRDYHNIIDNSKYSRLIQKNTKKPWLDIKELL